MSKPKHVHTLTTQGGPGEQLRKMGEDSGKSQREVPFDHLRAIGLHEWLGRRKGSLGRIINDIAVMDGH